MPDPVRPAFVQGLCDRFGARRLTRVTFDEMLDLASLGGRVLQIRSVEFAKKYNVPVHVPSSFSDEEGTMVVNEDASMEKLVVSGVICDKNQARITLKKVPDQPGVAAKREASPPVCPGSTAPIE